MTIEQILKMLNQASSSYKFGTLQQIRMNNLGRDRVASNHPFVIRRKFVNEGYAFHNGGSLELQFNVGFESETELRWGVAVSLIPSETLRRSTNSRDVSVMYPKLEKLSEFVRIYGHKFLTDFVMWHDLNGERSEDRLPEVVPRNLYSEGVFLFLGNHAPVEEFDPDTVLRDFDRLLPLYKYVEFQDNYYFPTPEEPAGFNFTPRTDPLGLRSGYATEGRRQTGLVEIVLRHREIQDSLMNQLIGEMGEQNVARDHENGIGGFVDLITNQDDVLEFYEIKVGNSARACIREALGQLMEYGYWPGAEHPRTLYVAAEPELDDDADQYLEYLRNACNIPIYYRQVNLNDGDGA